MSNKPMELGKALSLLPHATVGRRRLRLDELNTLVQLFRGIGSYCEVGVYFGLSLGVIGLCTGVKKINAYDTEKRNEVLDIMQLLDKHGVECTYHICDFTGVVPDFCDMALIDADHSYEMTLTHYHQCKMRAKFIVLHDVEMPGPGRVFKEVGGIKIVSSLDRDIAADGKILPPLGYGILR